LLGALRHRALTIGGRAISLKVRGSENEQAATVAFAKLKAQLGRSPTPAEAPPPPPPTPPTVLSLLEQLLAVGLSALSEWVATQKAKPPAPASDGPTVQTLFDRFITDATTRLKPTTIARYKQDGKSLTAAYGHLPVRSLTHHHLTEWLGSLKVSLTTKAIMLRSVSAFLGWCVREEVLEVNPAKKVKKPKSRSRSEDVLISEEDHRKLLAAATPQFREVLTVLEATGCRFGEIAGITAQTFHPEQAVAVLTEHKTDRTGKPRLVVLPDEVVELLKQKVIDHPTGSLLRSRKGIGWTGKAITQAMGKLRKKTDVKAIAYGYRHTFVTDALLKGLSNAIVGQLVGHTSTTVIDKHYSHLGANTTALRTSLNSFRGPSAVDRSPSETNSAPD
jgi:integrase